MTKCECPYLPEKYHTTHYGATDPATIQEYNPWCPEHGHLKEETHNDQQHRPRR